MMACGGIQGNENDPGAYRLTPVFRDPDAHLLPHHTGLFDGVFQCPLHCNTTSIGCLPANAPELNAAPAPMRRNLRMMNREQRFLRCPIEQTFAHIKKFTIVGEEYFRGEPDLQGQNFLLATQLAARLMRVRNAYPRGDKWMQGELEDWEKEWDRAGHLYIDPLHPELYV